VTVQESALVSLGLWIDGAIRESDGSSRIPSVDPYTGEPWATVPNATASDVDRAVSAARAAFEGPWRRMPGAERATILRRIAALVERDREHLARVESRDNGKLLRETMGVVGNLPRWFHWFAGAADRLTGTTAPAANPNYFVYTTREPVGVVAAIVPWNAPLILLTMKIAPALAAGCTVVVKTAEQTTASALELAKLTKEAGLPDGVLNIITGEGETTGRALVRHPGVDKVSFTGSTRAGVQVMQDAATHLAPVTLELGGKSANVVFADADLDAAANGVIAGVFAAAGQMCIAGGRVVVERSVHDALLEKVAARARTIKLGSPFEADSEMGPLATREQRDRVLDMIAAARAEGAELVCGGRAPEGTGFFVEPTVFTGVTGDMRLAREEVFGPVAAVFPFDTEDEAVRLANDTEYGLAGGIWTRDLQRGLRMARAVRAGTLWLNAYRVQDAAVPFGGTKASGFGRENGDEALHEVTEVKSVWIELSGQTRDPFVMG
jgi:(Z)-2-((N-methylformamido)methylene)-5-hydroxybutyrolactone dehydrogenase